MTAKNYQKSITELVRRFNPVQDRLTCVTRADGTLSRIPQSHEWEFPVGVRVHVMFSHRLPHSRRICSDWIHIGLPTQGDAYKRVNEHWKWNIHYSGNPEDVRAASLAELERRLNKLRAAFNI